MFWSLVGCSFIQAEKEDEDDEDDDMEDDDIDDFEEEEEEAWLGAFFGPELFGLFEGKGLCFLGLQLDLFGRLLGLVVA